MTGSLPAPRRAALAAAAALAVAYPLVVPNDYYVFVMSLAYIFAIATLGLNLILGYTGQLNLAHAGFMAVGAYTVGILTVDYGVPFWIAFVLAGALSAGLGLAAGLVSLRLKSHFFAIFTLCVGYIIYLVIEKAEGLTHGPVGIAAVPAPPGLGPVQFASTTGLYYLVLAFLMLAIFVMGRIVNSLLGRAFVAVRNGEELAQALGIDLMRTKLLAFVLSTLYAGIAGALYAGFVRFLGPDLAREHHTFDMLAFILVGGIGTLFGPVIGAVLLTWVTQSLQFLQDYRMLIFGPLLILLVMFVPQGIMGWLRPRPGTPRRARSADVAAEAPEGDAGAGGVRAGSVRAGGVRAGDVRAGA